MDLACGPNSEHSGAIALAHRGESFSKSGAARYSGASSAGPPAPARKAELGEPDRPQQEARGLRHGRQSRPAACELIIGDYPVQGIDGDAGRQIEDGIRGRQAQGVCEIGVQQPGRESSGVPVKPVGTAKVLRSMVRGTTTLTGAKKEGLECLGSIGSSLLHVPYHSNN